MEGEPMEREGEVILRPIGVVESAVESKSEMPIGGVRARVRVHPEFAEALEGVERFSHLWVVCYLHRADRSVLRAAPRKLSKELPERGVFALRSPSRPNPLSLTVVRLVKREGLVLEVEDMDATDGSPVLDIKPYYAGIDAFWGVRAPYADAKYAKISDGVALDLLLRMAEQYVGHASADAMLGVAAMFVYVRQRRRDPAAAVRRVRTNLAGQALDALYAIVQATPGSERIVCRPEGGGEGYVELTDEEGTWRISVTKDSAEAIMREPAAWKAIPWTLIPSEIA